MTTRKSQVFVRTLGVSTSIALAISLGQSPAGATANSASAGDDSQVQEVVIPAQAPPTDGLKKIGKKRKAGVVAAINKRRDSTARARCYAVWVTKSNSNWVTWTFSNWSYSQMEKCQMIDGYREFFVAKKKRWKWAGRFSGTSAPLCFYSVKRVPNSVQKDLGCWGE